MEQTLEEQIVELRNQGFSYDEIASQLGTNKTKVFRVLRKAGFHEMDETIEQELYETSETLEQKFQKLKQEFETFRNTFETSHKNSETDIEMFQNKIPRDIREHIVFALSDIENYIIYPKYFKKDKFDKLRVGITSAICRYIEFGEDMKIDVFRLPLFKLFVEFYFLVFFSTIKSKSISLSPEYDLIADVYPPNILHENMFKEMYQIFYEKEYEEEVVEEEIEE
ncbi:hypothetical protein AD998_18290 [bacterium 336/3]|nr:hypothetical protein AD998_18290 [bacterium 336/3]